MRKNPKLSGHDRGDEPQNTILMARLVLALLQLIRAVVSLSSFSDKPWWWFWD